MASRSPRLTEGGYPAVLELVFEDSLPDPQSLLRIPTQSGHRFRFDAGHRSDLKPATIPK